MKNRDRNTSTICMNMTQSNGTWLNGCLQKQMYFVSVDIKDPDHKVVARANLSFEQAARMLLYNGDVECTLERYRGEDGTIQNEKVEPPKSVHQRMTDRLDDTMTTLKKRLFDVEKDIYDMVNGDKKRSKTAMKEMLMDIKVIKEHLLENEAFTVQQAEEELGEMQSNAAGQLGLFIQSKTGELPNSETLKRLLPTGGENQIAQIPDKRVVATIDEYELKTRDKKSIEDMTALQVADAMRKRLKQIEAAQNKYLAANPDKDKENNHHLFFANAMERKGQKISICYVNYQGSSLLDLADAKSYLKFLLEIKSLEEFKTHWQHKEKK